MNLIKPRRLRNHPALRNLVRETSLTSTDFIYPLFVKEGLKTSAPVTSMPGVFQHSLKEIVKVAKQAFQEGLQAIILFGIPKHKDKKASGAYNPQGIVQQAVAAIKDVCPDLFVITDVCLCEYMDHGHCGLVNAQKEICNDPSLELLAQTAVSHAKAGADMVAPSDMMDGRVGAIRRALNATGFENTPIMSYAVKYASAYYGPFRDAAESSPQFGDRKTYQMDPSNWREALREAKLDEAEGADILMVKPALPYLDILVRLREKTNLPLAAYQVSGEYSQIMAASQKGWIDQSAVMMESLVAIKRAGAQLIVTYFAREAVKLCKK